MKPVTTQRQGVILLQIQGLDTPHGFSARLGGVSTGPYESLDLGLNVGDDPALVRENYRRFCAAVGADVSRCVCSRQVHRDAVRRVTSADAGKGLDRERDYEADALITDEPGLPLVIHTADCIPILLYDPVRRAVGACHAGWRGTALGIAARTVERMAACFGTDPAHLRCAIGPGISRCCFETRSDVPQAMFDALGEDARPFVDDHGDGSYHVDLKGLNCHWLERAGVPADRIAVCDACTACCPDMFYSHRRTGLPRGSLAALIMLA